MSTEISAPYDDTEVDNEQNLLIQHILTKRPELEDILYSPDLILNIEGDLYLPLSLVKPYIEDLPEDDDETNDESSLVSLSELKYLVTNYSGDAEEADIDDPIQLYLNQSGREPLLNAEEEVELAKRIESGKKAAFTLKNKHDQLIEEDIKGCKALIDDGQEAREHLARANTRLVVSIAKKYIGKGLPFPDLIQEGNLGLMRAVDKFDHKRGNRFSTYATWWIRQAITRGMADHGRTIRVPVHQVTFLNHVLKAQIYLQQEYGRKPTAEEIAKELDADPKKVRNLLRQAQHPISLELPVSHGDGQDSQFGDFIQDEDSPSPPDEVANTLLHEQLESALDRLPSKEAQILRLRYGLEDGRAYTLQEIAHTIGVTRERVRQLEAQALNRLRQSSAKSKLRDYLYEN